MVLGVSELTRCGFCMYYFRNGVRRAALMPTGTAVLKEGMVVV